MLKESPEIGRNSKLFSDADFKTFITAWSCNAVSFTNTEPLKIGWSSLLVFMRDYSSFVYNLIIAKIREFGKCSLHSVIMITIKKIEVS